MRTLFASGTAFEACNESVRRSRNAQFNWRHTQLAAGGLSFWARTAGLHAGFSLVSLVLSFA